MKSVSELAKEAGFEVVDGELRLYFDGSNALLKPNLMGTVVDGLKEFATLVRAESAKEDLEVLENLRKETIAQCEAGMIEAYQLGRAERKWVDLTDDEIWDVFISKDWTGEPLQLMSAVIAAFKEKNK